MTVVDFVRCQYPIPEVPNFAELDWQTESPLDAFAEQWEIRVDGSLWHREQQYELVVDESSPIGLRTQVISSRWVHDKWNGEFEIFHYDDHALRTVKFWFRDGMVKDYVLDGM